MKRIILALMLLSLGLTGCFPMDFMRQAPAPVPEPIVEQAPPVVTEDQVNDKTAGKCAKALRTELEYKLLDRQGKGE